MKVARRHIFSWSRLMVLAWTSLWMLAVPLFHVHPEADHRHGEVGHVHGGTVHTVWSPDLDCEFDKPAQTVRGHAQFAHSGDSHAEFGLSLLTDSTDRKSLKPLLIQVLGLSPNADVGMEHNVWIRWSVATLPSSFLFIHAIPSRGPPNRLA
jgi:hypothetical protein